MPIVSGSHQKNYQNGAVSNQLPGGRVVTQLRGNNGKISLNYVIKTLLNFMRIFFLHVLRNLFREMKCRRFTSTKNQKIQAWSNLV